MLSKATFFLLLRNWVQSLSSWVATCEESTLLLLIVSKSTILFWTNSELQDVTSNIDYCIWLLESVEAIGFSCWEEFVDFEECEVVWIGRFDDKDWMERCGGITVDTALPFVSL